MRINIKPLSVNKAWQGRRYKTKAYKEFQNAMLFLLPKTKEKYTGMLKIDLTYGFSNKLSDIDNPCKLVLDCLCKKYGFDDRQIYTLTQKKEIVKKGDEFIEIKIEEIK